MLARSEPGWLSLAELFRLCNPKENQFGKPNYDEKSLIASEKCQRHGGRGLVD